MKSKLFFVCTFQVLFCLHFREQVLGGIIFKPVNFSNFSEVDEMYQK